MAKKKNDKKKKASNAKQQKDGGLMVDPARIRFQHSRIRPVFSGCGRSVTQTLESIRQGELSPSDLPPIQVLVGPVDDKHPEDGPWYFSLNNRRLWVLKRCREEGLLENNKIYVRVRQPKSEAETARYSVENCALEAKIMPEKGVSSSNKETTTGTPDNIEENLKNLNVSEQEGNDIDPDRLGKRQPAMGESDEEGSSSSSDADDSSDDEPGGRSNRFASLF